MPSILAALTRRCGPAITAFVLLLTLAEGARAHFIGLTDTAIQLTRAGVRIVQTIPAEELAELGGADAADADAVRSFRRDAVTAGWHIRADGTACEPAGTSVQALPRIDALQFDLRFACPPSPAMLDIGYPLATRFAAGHLNPARIWVGRKQMPWRFDRETPTLRLPVATILERSGEQLQASFPDDDPNSSLATQGRSEGVDPAAAANAPRPSLGTMASLYVPSGVEHILKGPDHVAFVLALLLIPMGIGRLLVSITLFTLAHSLTLALAHFGVLSLPPSFTEPFIALSVLAMGGENLLIERHPGVQRFREATVFGFGLVHGVGLSYQLEALPSLSTLEATMRLLMFNVGVELGQLVIVVLAWPVLHVLAPGSARVHVTRLGSAALVGLGAFWLLERLGLG